MRKILLIASLLPAGYQLVAGSRSGRVIALALLLTFGSAVAGEWWAVRHSDHWLARALYVPRPISTARIGLFGIVLIGLYVATFAVADKLMILDSALPLTVAFFAVVLGLIALAAVIDRGIQRLRGRRHAG